MFRSLIVVGLVFFNLSLEAEVSKEFLVKMRSQFKSTLGAPLSESHFNSPLTEDEQSFLSETHKHDYSDIFRGTLPKDEEVYSYNLFHLRGVTNARAERKLNAKTECAMVYTEDGKHFVREKLQVFRNPPAEKGKKGWRFSYCAGHDEDSDLDSVIYYFHGAAGNPYNFVQRDATFALRERLRELGPMPRWVSVSFGSIGHLAEIDLERRFFEVIVPYIEEQMGFNSRPAKRFGMGISQGGANVVHAVMKSQGFFDAAVAVCPAVAALDPYGTKEQKHEQRREYRHRTGADRVLMRLALFFLPKEFQVEDYWKKNVDALRLGQKHLDANSTPLYIQTSVNDELGLQEGGQLFAMLARTKGAPVMFEELAGGHCVMRPRRIAEFFQSYLHGDVPLQLKLLK